MNFFSLSLLVSVLFVIASCAQVNPKVSLSAERVVHHGHIEMKGTGFSRSGNVYSHLRRPDGTEFPVLPMMTNDRGEFTHDIDTLLLSPGIHQVWVEDEKSKKVSEI